MVQVGRHVRVLPGERVVPNPPHHLALLGDVGAKHLPVQEHVRLPHDQHRRHGGQRQPQPGGGTRPLPLPSGAQRRQVGQEQRQHQGGRARLGRQGEPDCGPRHRGGGPRPALRRAHGGEYRQHDEEREERVDAGEVAQLNVQDRGRSEQRRQQGDATVGQAQPQEVHGEHRQRVGQRGDRPPGQPHLDQVQPPERLGAELDALQQVEGQAAVGEPAGVPRAFVGIQEDAQVGGGRQRELVHRREDGALVGVKQVPVVPVDAEQAQRKGQREDARQRRSPGPRAKSMPCLGRGGEAFRRRRSGHSSRIVAETPRRGRRATAPCQPGRRTGPPCGRSSPTRCRTSPQSWPACRP